MALIRDASDSLALEITPIPPAGIGPRDAYNLAVLNNGLVEHETQFSYVGMQTGHCYIRQLARAFRYSPRLVDQNCGFGIGGSVNPEYDAPVSVSVNAIWVHAVLHGITVYYPRQYSAKSARRVLERRIYINMYLSADKIFSPDKTRVAPWIALPRFYCHPNACEQFGLELLGELREASRMRSALHLESPDEIDDDQYGLP